MWVNEGEEGVRVGECGGGGYMYVWVNEGEAGSTCTCMGE